MKVSKYITTVLGMLRAFPGPSVEIALPPRRPTPLPANTNLTDFPATGSAHTGCHQRDHIFGCLVPSTDMKPRFCTEYPGFFDTAHWHESGAAQAYIDWTKTIDQNSAEWTNSISEPTFFAQQVLGWRDFDCGVSFKGCDMKPTYDDILTRISDRHIARQVYFILKPMENLSLITSVVAVSLRIGSLPKLCRWANIEQEQSIPAKWT